MSPRAVGAAAIRQLRGRQVLASARFGEASVVLAIRSGLAMVWAAHYIHRTKTHTAVPRSLLDIGRGSILFTTMAGGALSLKGSGISVSGDLVSTEPKGLMDQMVMDAAKNGQGKPIIPNLSDPRFKGMDKYSYGETSAGGARSEVHCVRDPITGRTMDFRFKHHAERIK